MKRIIKIIFVLLICLSVKTVYAENYKIKELIPRNVTTTIHTDNFSYKEMYFDSKGVHFKSIKNLTDEELPISISVGLFDKNRKNIGTINYCNLKLKGKEEEKEFDILFNKKYLGDKNTIKEIKYIAVLEDNITCKTKGSKTYIGLRVEKIGASRGNKFDSKTELFLSLLTIMAGAFVVLILYKLIFTRTYRNVDGGEVREAFDDINRELKEQREEELRKNPPVVEKKKPNKPIEILDQEESAKKEDKSGTDLHNLYK